jgi:hypothetical protein
MRDDNITTSNVNSDGVVAISKTYLDRSVFLRGFLNRIVLFVPRNGTLNEVGAPGACAILRHLNPTTPISVNTSHA